MKSKLLSVTGNVAPIVSFLHAVWHNEMNMLQVLQKLESLYVIKVTSAFWMHVY